MSNGLHTVCVVGSAGLTFYVPLQPFGSDAVAVLLARWRTPPLTDLTDCQSVPAVVAVPVFGVSAFAHSKLYRRECFTVHAGPYPGVSYRPALLLPFVLLQRRRLSIRPRGLF